MKAAHTHCCSRVRPEIVYNGQWQNTSIVLGGVLYAVTLPLHSHTPPVRWVRAYRTVFCLAKYRIPIPTSNTDTDSPTRTHLTGNYLRPFHCSLFVIRSVSNFLQSSSWAGYVNFITINKTLYTKLSVLLFRYESSPQQHCWLRLWLRGKDPCWWLGSYKMRKCESAKVRKWTCIKCESLMRKISHFMHQHHESFFRTFALSEKCATSSTPIHKVQTTKPSGFCYFVVHLIKYRSTQN